MMTRPKPGDIITGITDTVTVIPDDLALDLCKFMNSPIPKNKDLVFVSTSDNQIMWVDLERDHSHMLLNGKPWTQSMTILVLID